MYVCTGMCRKDVARVFFHVEARVCVCVSLAVLPVRVRMRVRVCVRPGCREWAGDRRAAVGQCAGVHGGRVETRRGRDANEER